MSILIRPVSFLALGMLCSVHSAHGGDLDQVITTPGAPVTLPITEASGWYLRGDISTSVKTRSKPASFSTLSAISSSSSGITTSSSFRENDLSGGVGVGYRINDMFRADATVDVFGGHADIGIDACAGVAAGIPCAISSDGKFTSYSVMANAYIDLATIAKFTPYIGAGIGASHVNWGSFGGTASCAEGACASAANLTVNNSGLSKWRTTWALMAGVSYDLSERTKIDLGYRYSRIPSADMFAYGSSSTLFPTSGATATDGGFDRHEIRAGIRITGW